MIANLVIVQCDYCTSDSGMMLLVGEEVFVVGEEVCAMAAKDGTRNRFDDLNDAGAVELWPVGRLRIIRCRCSRTVADGAVENYTTLMQSNCGR